MLKRARLLQLHSNCVCFEYCPSWCWPHSDAAMEQPPDPFERLPDEVFQLIFGAIRDCKTLVRCMAVSRSFREQSARIPFLSIVCPGTFPNYDAKLKGIYAMVKGFRSLETLVVRVGQPKDEPPSWARCMRYAEIGSSVEKFVFMAAKSGDFSEFDVVLAQTDDRDDDGAGSLQGEEEQYWERWRDELLSRERERSPRIRGESSEDRDTGLGPRTGSPEHGTPVEVEHTLTTVAGTLQPEMADLGASTSAPHGALQQEAHQSNLSEEHTCLTPSDRHEEERDLCLLDPPPQEQSITEVAREGKGKQVEEEASSSSGVFVGMPSSSNNCADDEMKEGNVLPSSVTTDSNLQSPSMTVREMPMEDAQTASTSSLDLSSTTSEMRGSQNPSARYLFRRRFLEQGRRLSAVWDFRQERCRLPDFVLRQVIAPSNDILKRMVPVIVFAIVQGLDEFRDCIPSFISKFPGLKQFVLVDMVESVTVFMREHQIQELRGQCVQQREASRDCASSGSPDDYGTGTKSTDPCSEISAEHRKSRSLNPDVKEVEDLPDLPFNTLGTGDRERGKSGRARDAGRAWKDGRRSVQDHLDRGKQKLPFSDDETLDEEIRRWRGRGIVLNDENRSKSDSQMQLADTFPSSDDAGDTFRGSQEPGLRGSPTCRDFHALDRHVSTARAIPTPPMGNNVHAPHPISPACQCAICVGVVDAGQEQHSDERQVVAEDSVSPCEDASPSGHTSPTGPYVSLRDLAFRDHAKGGEERRKKQPRPRAAGRRATWTHFQVESRTEDESHGIAGAAEPGSDVASGSASAACAREAEGTAAEPSGEADTQEEPPWVGYSEDSEVPEATEDGGQEPGLGAPERDGRADLVRQQQLYRRGLKLEQMRSRKDSKGGRKGRDDARGFSVRRSHRLLVERTQKRGRHSSLPGSALPPYVILDYPNEWKDGRPEENAGGEEARSPDAAGSSEQGPAEGLVPRAEEQDPESDNPGSDAAFLKRMKGKQVADEEAEEDEEAEAHLVSDPGGPSTPQAPGSSSMDLDNSAQERGDSKPQFGFHAIDFTEAGDATPDPNPNPVPTADSLGAPLPASRLGWIQLREAIRDRPRTGTGYPPLDRHPRDRNQERETWRDRLRRARELRREGEGDRGRDPRRDRVRDGVRKRQRDMEREALYFDISFWRAEQVVAHRYSLSDVSMCVATHSARPLSPEELDMLARAALAGPLLIATIGYVNKQVGSHNL